MDMPDHDLEPPRFSRKALERLLNDWPAVKAMIMSGVKNDTENKLNDQPYLKNQSGTAFLDKFMHCLLFKCNAEVLTSSFLVSEKYSFTRSCIKHFCFLDGRCFGYHTC